MVNAVVLAGGEERGELRSVMGTPYRALIELGGRPLVAGVMEALRSSQSVETVALVAPEEVRAALDARLWDRYAPAGASLVENISLGLAALKSRPPALLVTCDLAMLTPQAVDDFVERSLVTGAELTYPFVSQQDCQSRFPEGRRTYVRLREGKFTGGNLMLIRPEFLDRHGELVQRIYLARKSPVQMARVLGVIFILRFITGRLTVPQIERRAEQILGGRAAAIRSSYPEVAFDVDKLEDLEAARREVELAGGSSPGREQS